MKEEAGEMQSGDINKCKARVGEKQKLNTILIFMTTVL